MGHPTLGSSPGAEARLALVGPAGLQGVELQAPVVELVLERSDGLLTCRAAARPNAVQTVRSVDREGVDVDPQAPLSSPQDDVHQPAV